MDPRHLRSSSPGSRRLHQPGRSSTGTIIYPEDYDPYHAPTRSSRESLSGPRSSADRLLAPNTTVRQYRVDGGSARRVDDYPVSPRRATLDPLAAAARRPLTIAPLSSPNRYRPVISSAKEQPSGSFESRPRDDEPHYLLPASSALSRRDHHRTYSADSHSEAGRYLSDGRDRHEKAGYRSSGVGGRRQGYNLSQPLVRQPKDNDDEDLGYEYTDRREQMYRDTAPRPRQRRTSDSGRRERPLSMTGLEDYPSRLLQASRGGRPPVTTRGFDKLDRSGSLRHEYRIPREPDSLPRDRVPLSDTEDQRKHRLSHASRAPVSLHQEKDAGPVDDGYPSHREDRKDHRDRHSHGPRRAGSLDRRAGDYGLGAPVPPEDDRRRASNDKMGRHHEPDPRKDRGDLADRDRHHRTSHRSDRGETEVLDHRTRDEPRKDKQEKSRAEDLVLGAAGLGAAALVAEGVKERKHRKKDSANLDPDMPLPDRTRIHGDDRLAFVPDPNESSSRNGDQTDEERRERRRRRHREKVQHEEEARLADRAARRHEELIPPMDESHRDSGSYERDPRHPPPTVPQAKEAPKSHREHRHRHHDEESYSDNSSEDERRNAHKRKTSQVRVVSPAKDEKPEPKPKGILRPPREKFPEDPAPVREGVAPLKDAGKKGIPPNARWTKIDRRLVNPEALDQGNERYEERIEYVIVLRVLTKEEIQAYAKRTQEIRDDRYLREDQQRQILAIEDVERKYDHSPALRIEDQPYEEANGRGYDGGYEGSRERVRGENVPPRRESGEVRRESGEVRRESGEVRRESGEVRPTGMSPVEMPDMVPPHMRERLQTVPAQPTQAPVLPPLPPDGPLRDDPMRPGTYTGYQRNPPPPPMGSYAPMPGNYAPVPGSYPAPPPIPPKTAL